MNELNCLRLQKNDCVITIKMFKQIDKLRFIEKYIFVLLFYDCSMYENIF